LPAYAEACPRPEYPDREGEAGHPAESAQPDPSFTLYAPSL